MKIFEWVGKLMAISGVCLSFASPLNAQIVPDGTLGQNSTVILKDNVFEINGGTVTGSTLFHSFKYFSVTGGKTAFFNNSTSIENILTRVTGENISNIDGILKTNGSANLFLINPKGIVFGANAQLNIGGSFIASTASSIKLAGGNEFSAVNPAAPPLLTVNVPVGLQFGSQPAPIIVQGPGNNLKFEDITFATLTDERPTGLLVPGKTLALVGGEIHLNGGNLTAPAGRIELGSVGSNSTVILTPIDIGWSLGYPDVQNLQNIRLTDAASVDTSGDHGGEIAITGLSVSLLDGSTILANNNGHLVGGFIKIFAPDSVYLKGSNKFDYPSVLVAEVTKKAVGNTKGISIETGKLYLLNGPVISTATFGEGNAGSIHLKAKDFIKLSGFRASGDPSYLLSEVNAGASGNAGNMTIETGKLILETGGTVSADTSGYGNGANLIVKAKDIEMSALGAKDRIASLRTSVQENATGKAGNIFIEANSLILRDVSSISTEKLGSGQAGNIKIKADNLVVGTQAEIKTTSEIGQGGNIEIDAGNILIKGGMINASVFQDGRGGDIVIRASQSLTLTGAGPASISNDYLAAVVGNKVKIPDFIHGIIITGTKGQGSAGDIIISTQKLRLQDGGFILTPTLGEGRAGNLSIEASDSIDISGSLIGATTAGAGVGGDLKMISPLLTVRDGGEISVSAFSTGNAGDIFLQVNSLKLDGGAMQANSSVGKGGNINLQVSNLLLLRNGSEISTRAGFQKTDSGDGGNISISNGTIVGLENSNINANAFAGVGGNIRINSQGVFLSPNSAITASSERGINGIVEIKTPELNPTSGLLELPVSIFDTTALIGQNPCNGIAKGSSFTITGKGGMPSSPDQPLAVESVLPDFRENIGVGETISPFSFTDKPIVNSPDSLVEAQGWILSPDGKVILTTSTASTTPQTGTLPRTLSNLCHQREGKIHRDSNFSRH